MAPAYICKGMSKLLNLIPKDTFLMSKKTLLNDLSASICDNVNVVIYMHKRHRRENRLRKFFVVYQPCMYMYERDTFSEKLYYMK